MKCLYVTYDGLTDNLGASQILPYLFGLAEAGHRITILSCEKEENFSRRGKFVAVQLEARGIAWSRLAYHKRPPVLSTVWDIARMTARAWGLCRREKFEALHVRSYVPAVVGLFFKRFGHRKLIFDMRGFWADERVDGGLWNQKKPLYRFIFRFFKFLESRLLARADAVVSLTEAARTEMLSWPGSTHSGLVDRLWVIPCCVDLDAFSLPDGDRKSGRSAWGIGESDLVCGYLGSIGTWYCLDEMMDFFRRFKTIYPNAKFLFVTPDSRELVHASAGRLGVDRADVVVVAADRKEVPALLKLVDLGVFFIRPCYSKISSSATKLGEFLAAGIPVVANHGIGDQGAIFSRNRIGHLVRDFSPAELQAAAEKSASVMELKPSEIRAVAAKEFSIARALGTYGEIYDFLSPGVEWHQ